MLSLQSQEYQQKVANEISFYRSCENVHDLPEIFHYWSNKYLLPKFQAFHFSSPDDYFLQATLAHLQQLTTTQQVEILSIGAGNGESEVTLAENIQKAGYDNFTITCLDINEHMLKRCRQAAQNNHVTAHIKTLKADFNQWQPDTDYDVIMANQCLHHVINLEGLFDHIFLAMKKDAVFLVSDMIGRNGHMRWPEALDLLNPIWEQLPAELKHNQLLKRYEASYINHDCSNTGFEGIRAQDILPLLVERFNFDLFIPFANIVLVLIDRPFGHNYNHLNPEHTAIIDKVHHIDEKHILEGLIKPTQMISTLSKKHKTTQLIDPKLTPSFCIRKT